MVEEGQPEYIEQEIATLLRRRDIQTRLHGKDLLPAAGEYTRRGAVAGPARVCCPATCPARRRKRPSAWLAGNRDTPRKPSRPSSSKPLPNRPPSFCIGCPERPVFSALKLAQQEVGPVHIAADIGCHAFGTFEPFSMGHSILGYGMSLASRAGVSPMMQRRTLSIMGDGGFWHNGLLTGVQSALFNSDDAVLLIFKNGYFLGHRHAGPHLHAGRRRQASVPPTRRRASTHTNTTIESTLKGLGVQWLRTVHTYASRRCARR